MRVCCFMVIEKGISLEHMDYLLGSAHSWLQITPSHNQLWGGKTSPIKVHFWHFLTLRYRWPSNSFIIYSTVPAKLVITVMCAYRWKLYIYIYIYMYIFGGYHLIFPYSHGRCLVRSPSFSPYWSPELHLPSSSSRGGRSPGEDRRLHDVPQFQRSRPRGSTPWSLVTGCEKRWDFSTSAMSDIWLLLLLRFKLPGLITVAINDLFVACVIMILMLSCYIMII